MAGVALSLGMPDRSGARTLLRAKNQAVAVAPQCYGALYLGATLKKLFRTEHLASRKCGIQQHQVMCGGKRALQISGLVVRR